MAAATLDSSGLIEYILQNIEGDSNETARKLLNESIEKAQDFETHRAQASRWLTWAHKREHVGIVSADVPINVLPNGWRGQLHDVKVTCRRGPDDAIYDRHKDIRDKVARGNCFLEIQNGPQTGMSCLIYALKKFTGGLGDDDDRDKGDNSTWKRYFTKPLSEAVSIVTTRKANGEAAHLTARYIDGRFLICSGSKNVHVLMFKREDLDRYTGGRYAIAKEICEAVFDCLDDMTEEDRTRLLTFLSLTQFTAVLEILNPGHQHVEDLTYLKRPLLQFICWTTSELEAPTETQLCTMPPNIAIEIARCLGLPTVEYDVIAVSDVEERMKQVRQGYGYEGEVFYFLDSTHSVIGLLKKKTIWYILCRAIREKARSSCQIAAKSPSTFSKGSAITKVEKRIGEIQEWLGLDDQTTAAWKSLGHGFVSWALHKTGTGEVSFSEVVDLFPVTWKRYLQEEKVSDKIEANWHEPGGSDD